MLKSYSVILVTALMGWSVLSAQTSQTPDCGSPAKTEAQIARRRMAILAARQINTSQAQTRAQRGRYVPLAELRGVTVPAGFDVQVSTDGTTYTFSVKDIEDACKAAVFSDQNGLIYTATPLR